MSRFYIRQREAQFPLSELPDRIKCWTSVGKEAVIIFNSAGKYVVWDFHDEKVTHRGELTVVRDVRKIGENLVVCTNNKEAIVYNYDKMEVLAKLALDDFRFIDSLEVNKGGFTIVSSNMDGLRRFRSYSGGAEWKVTKQVDLARNWLAIDTVAEGTIVNFKQYVTTSEPQKNFTFGIWEESKDFDMQTIQLSQEIPMTVVRIIRMVNNFYLIVGNSNDVPIATAYTVAIDQENTKTVDGPIVLSKTPLVDVIIYEPHSHEIVFIAQADGIEIKPEECPLAPPEKCKISIEVFNLDTKVHQNIKYFPNYSQMSRVYGHNAFIMKQADAVTKHEKTLKFRLFKIINQTVQYIHLMRQLRIEQKYGKEMLTAALHHLTP